MRLHSAFIATALALGLGAACTDAFTSQENMGGSVGAGAHSTGGGALGGGGGASGDDPCVPNLCKFNARCGPEDGGGYRCACPPGSEGSDCGEINGLSSDAEGLVLWLDAADGGSVTTEGEALSLWEDRSDNGNDFEAADASRPQLVDEGLNGLPLVRFDGIDDGMGHANFAALQHAANYTIVVVGYATGNAQPLLSGYAIGAGNTVQEGFLLASRIDAYPQALHAFHRASLLPGGGGGGAGGSVMRLQEKVATQENAVQADKPNIIAVIRDNASLQIRVNGVQKDQTAVKAEVFGTAMHLQLGRETKGGGPYLKGDIAEIIVFDAALDDKTMRILEGGLRFKWFGSPLP